jgi:seryl-tRNA synthetase
MPIAVQDFRDESKGGCLEKIRETQAARGKPMEVIDEIIDLDNQWRQAMFRADELRRNGKTISKAIGKEMKGKTEGYQERVAELKATKAAEAKELAASKTLCEELELQVKRKVNTVGNYIQTPEGISPVPIGQVEEESNVIVRTWGERKIPMEGKLLHHHELLYMIGGYEPERGVKVAGHRGYFLTDIGVMLNQALIQYSLAFLRAKGYKAIQPPLFMRKEVMAETAQLEQFDEELYKVVGSEGSEAYLIATSEQPISAYHRGEWLTNTDLPCRYVGVSNCFRKEAGSHGKDAWGIFRVHQFEKIEQFVVTSPEDSWAEHEAMIAISEEFYQALGLSYHVIAICSGHLNNAAAKKYDLEAWFPTLGVMRELVSCSNCTDYQSRGMETRFGQKAKGQEKKYVHMLNSTLCATTRTICAIMENYQTPEGVRVPAVLQPFMGGMEIMPFVRAKLKVNQSHKTNQ